MSSRRRKKMTGEDWLKECFAYEATHEIAFASPRALLEARMIEALDKARRPRRQTRRNGSAHSPRTAATAKT